jgi:CheY-like chemotaxis protein
MSKPIALIVEDEPQLGAIFSLALSTDFDTQLCVDGLDAIHLLETLTPDIVFLDLHLPGASGETIMKHIRSQPRLAKTRVVLATADHTMADFVFLKPISPNQLYDIAMRLCK